MHQQKYVALSISLCLSVELMFCLSLILNTQAQSACLSHSFRQYQIILHCCRLNGLLEGFYIQQRHDPELTPCQCELKFDVLPVTPPRYVTHLYIITLNFLASTQAWTGHCAIVPWHRRPHFDEHRRPWPPQNFLIIMVTISVDWLHYR